MKKWIMLLAAASLCLAMIGCGKTENPDHAYVLALMERGDYDMAISVLENLRNQAGQSPTTSPAPTTEATEPAISQQQVIVLDMISRFMSENGASMVAEYENTMARKARSISVDHVMEYRLGDWDGFSAHFLMAYLQMDLAYTDQQGDTFIYDGLFLLLDLDSGKLYNSTMLNDNIPDPAVTKDDVCLRAVNAYLSYIHYSGTQLWSDAEVLETMAKEEIAAINNALN